MDNFEKEAKALFETSVTDLEFNKIITAIYPKPDELNKQGLTVWSSKIDLINDLYFDSPTNANIKGTAWGVFNTLTERLDYFRGERKTKNGAQNKLANASGFDPVTNAEKNKLFRQVKELAGVK